MLLRKLAFHLKYTTMSKQKIKIDVFSDINCPWCYVGERRLAKAMEAAEDKYEFDVNFKAYELNRNIPQAGMTREAYFKNSYGPDAMSRIAASEQRLVSDGAAEGIDFQFKPDMSVNNTFNGHRLIWLAGELGVQEQVTSALFKAYFTENLNMNDTAVLTKIGVENGIPAEKLEGFFESEAGKQEVREMENFAQSAGISGVPAFVINDQYLVSGAQPSETLLNVFQQVAPALQEINLEGDSCGIDGQNC